MKLVFVDYLVIILYFFIIFYIGFFLSQKKKGITKGEEDYLLAGRKLTLPLFVGTLVATWYGSILGIGEFVYRGGLVAWLCFCFPYYIAAALFAYFIAGKIRKSNSSSIPEQIARKYGEKSALTASGIVLIITIPSSYILMLGVLLQMFTGWDLWLCILTGALGSLVYLYKGGFKADVLTNSLQFVLMYLGFAALLAFSIMKFGFPGEALFSKPEMFPENHLKIFGGYSWEIIAVWFVIALQTFIDPSFYQRCAAAKTPKIAQRGIFVSVLCWMIFDMMTIQTALYARAYFPINNPLMAYPVLSDAILPPLWKGIFVTALLATVMSTLSSYAFLSGTTIGNDIIPNILIAGKKDKGSYVFKNRNKWNIETYSKIGLVVSSAIAVLMAIALPSAVDLIYKTSSVAVPGLLLPLLFTYSKKFKMKNAFIIMLLSSSCALIWTILSIIAQDNHFFMSELFKKYEAMLVGLLISVVLSIFNIKKVA